MEPCGLVLPSFFFLLLLPSPSPSSSLDACAEERGGGLGLSEAIENATLRGARMDWTGGSVETVIRRFALAGKMMLLRCPSWVR